MAANNHPSRGDDAFKELIPIIILFCIPTGVTQLIGLVMLLNLASKQGWFRKLKNSFRTLFSQPDQGTANAWQGADDGWQRVRETPQGQPSAQRAAGGGQSANSAGSAKSAQAQPPRKMKKLGKGPGRGLVIGGGIVSGIFGMGTTIGLAETISDLANGWYAGDDFAALTVMLFFLAGGLGMLFSGLSMNRERDRFSTYLAYIGANREVDLARMSANLDVPLNKLIRDLRKMLSKGYLPTGYVDLAEGKLFLTEMGYRPPEPKVEPEPEPEPVRTVEDEDAILREIRQVNDFIPDEVMSAKIDRIEEITRKILAYQKKHPERAGQLRSFLNYYLPTTLKILRAYAQLDAQGVEGENISAAKGRIEGMMDQVVYGFEKQLDKLFQEDAMDVAADVEVLENMLKKDGLSDGQGITLEI